MEKERKSHSFIKKPIYPGGEMAMKELIKKNLLYPKKAIENKIEGYVALNYEINYKGIVTKVKVISELGYGCDEEAIRLVKMFKFKVPKNPRKLKVKFNRNIKIHFKLKKEIESKLKSNLNISYTSVKKKEQSQDDMGHSASYNYTINID